MSKQTHKTKKNRVSIIQLFGQIFATEGKDGINPESVRELFKEVLDKKSELVILDINSPGGSPVGSAMIYDYIKNLQKKGIKVIAHCRDLCASGGYFIVSACDEIYSYRSSLIGSVGVIFSGFGFNKLIERYDIEYREVTAGKNKSFFNPFKEFAEKDQEYIKALAEDVHLDFIDYVFSSRTNELFQKNKDEICTAKVFTGREAMEKGLIDGIKNIQQILDDIYGEDAKLKIHRPKVKVNFLKKILGRGLNVQLNMPNEFNSDYKMKF
jgi:signal peptide peptidase SppA